MIAILGGLGAAFCWAGTTLASSRSSRMIGAPSVLAWVMLVGFAMVAPFFIVAGAAPTKAVAGWLLLVGSGNVVGLLFEYAALRLGQVGIVAAIASTEGAFAAILSVISGEPVAAPTALALAVIAGGTVLATLSADGSGSEERPGASVALAIAAALSFGIGLFAAGHVSGEVGMAWVLLPARLVGVLFVAVPLGLSGRLRITRPAAPFVITGGICEVVGLTSFVIAARHSIGVAAVLSSQFAAFSAIGAFLFFGERLRRIQIAGVVAILMGVTALAALQS